MNIKFILICRKIILHTYFHSRAILYISQYSVYVNSKELCSHLKVLLISCCDLFTLSSTLLLNLIMLPSLKSPTDF